MIVLHQESGTTLVLEAMRRGQLVLSRDLRFDAVKVFCGVADAGAWIESHAEHDLVDITVVQNGGWISIVIAFRDSARSRT